LNNNKKLACLFFDHMDIYANFRRMSHPGRVPSTDLSTVFVDKYVQSNGPCRRLKVRL